MFRTCKSFILRHNPAWFYEAIVSYRASAARDAQDAIAGRTYSGRGPADAIMCHGKSEPLEHGSQTTGAEAAATA